MSTSITKINCPICDNPFPISNIESHADTCATLKASEERTKKQKRGKSSELLLQDATLFSGNKPDCSRTSEEPNFNFQVSLAQLIQPTCLNDIHGHYHVLSKNSYLRSLLDENIVPNMILWGPPGCGKTSLAHVTAQICLKNPHQYSYHKLHAANCGLKEIRVVIDTQTNKEIVLYIDEIHKLTKQCKHLLLKHIQTGKVILIGATTENPSFFLSNSFLNYCKVIVMDKLRVDDLISILERALSFLNIHILEDRNTITNYCKLKLDGLFIHKSAIVWLAETCDGDARIALNNLQLCLDHRKRNTNRIIKIDDIKDQIKKAHLMYDQNGEEHHNIISAMHESIKGYSDNGALYWTARMLIGGEDPMFIARRLVRTSSEDTGNADPKALQLAVSTMKACQSSLDNSTCELLVSQCAVYLARAPTYQKTITGLNIAKKIISESGDSQPPVPVHLRRISSEILNNIECELSPKKIKKSFMPVGLEDVQFL